MKYIWQLVCLTPDEHGSMSNEFIVGTYSSEEKAVENKDLCEKQVIEAQMRDIEYDIRKHRIIE